MIQLHRPVIEATLRALAQSSPHTDISHSWKDENWRIQRSKAIKMLQEVLASYPVAAEPSEPTFQMRVQPWLLACFGEEIAGDWKERNHRFLEEALELVQACGCTAHEAHQLVDYVYGRPVGEPAQEVGGVMVTLAALCLANSLDMHDAAEVELSRIWTKVEAIRAKQAVKPKYSPLPAAPVEPILKDAIDRLRSQIQWLRDGKLGDDVRATAVVHLEAIVAYFDAAAGVKVEPCADQQTKKEPGS